MSGNIEAVRALGQILRPSDDPPPLLLLGAGASFRSGVPMAAESVKQIARRVYSEQVLKGARPPERVRPTKWEVWLQSFPWFIQGNDRLAENFPLVVEHLLRPAEFRKRVILDILKPANGISRGYKVVSELMMRGLINTIFTTNFDTCLVDALKERQPHIRHIHEVNRGPGDFAQFNVFNKCQVIWLHGRAEQYADKNATDEIGSLDPKLTDLIRPLTHGAPLVVVGFRGSEPSIMEGVFGQNTEGRLDFPRGVYWCIRHGETPHPNVEALARRLGPNFRLLRIDGFDELFEELDREVAGQERYSARPEDAASAEHLAAYDERIVTGASIDDLDLDLALSVLREYCVKLKRAPITSESLTTLMKEQGLVISGDGGLGITAGALLLFGKNTQQFFPHAVVAVTEAGKKREVYDGNLIGQHKQLLAKIESVDVNPVLKVKKQRHHDERPAYPPRALVELLVNMLVHRDYAMHEPATIEIRPGAEIVFSNPGGLTQRLAGRLTLDNDGRFNPTETITDTRNPSLCDVFFGLSAMEREGTGLIEVKDLMGASGGGTAFFHRHGRFEAIVERAPSAAGSNTVARSDVPTGIYILNVLPFSVLPERVSIVQLRKPLRERPAGFDLSECGTFVDRGTELWSFVPLPLLLTILGPMADEVSSAWIARSEIEADPDQRRVLSWLLRKHWERYVSGFSDQGLVLEEGKRKNRAYFQGRDGQSRTVVWNSPQRRNIKRDVAKKRGDGPKTWFENEGFSFEIVELDAQWCVRIKPFYMFTGRNGKTPLPSFTRTSKATSRMKFDRNKNVEADLLFWSRLLGKGGETINIGSRHVDDLILESSFLTVEVPEIGLVSDDGKDQDRMPA
ncbi:SIR2 family protein [Brucella sp. RRSP16]|uniref:SIR2 family protein n=1 Tax=Brucella sp. RRSP16 TaxID=3453707 RepID=UPI003FCCADD9